MHVKILLRVDLKKKSKNNVNHY